MAPPSPNPSGYSVALGNFSSLWAWDATNIKWFFYSPAQESQGGLPAVKAYTDLHNYLDFNDLGKTLGPGVGFWVNKSY